MLKNFLNVRLKVISIMALRKKLDLVIIERMLLFSVCKQDIVLGTLITAECLVGVVSHFSLKRGLGGFLLPVISPSLGLIIMSSPMYTVLFNLIVCFLLRFQLNYFLLS